jgi:hypothetical protein
MSIGTGTHFENPILGSKDLYEDVPVDILSRTQRFAYFVDFVEPDTDSTAGMMNVTTIVSGTGAVVANSVNGIFRLSNTAVNEGIGSAQAVSSAGVSFAPSQGYLTPSTTDALDGSPNRMISFGARVSVSDYSNCDWYVGLGGQDGTFMDATGVLLTTGGDNEVGFHHLVATANDTRLISAGAGVANQQVTLLSNAQVPRAIPADAAVDGVMFEYGIRIIGTQDVEYYINRTLRHRRRMANALASTLVPTFCMISNAAAITMDIDYFWTCQTR